MSMIAMTHADQIRSEVCVRDHAQCLVCASSYVTGWSVLVQGSYISDNTPAKILDMNV